MLLRLIRESTKPLCMNYKTDPHCGSKKEKRNYGKVKNNEKISTIMPFIQFLFISSSKPIFCDAFVVSFLYFTVK